MLGIAGASSMGGGGGDSSNSGGGQGVHGEGEDHHPGWASFRGMGLELEGIGEREREGLRRSAEGEGLDLSFLALIRPAQTLALLCLSSHSTSLS
jgi:hypothetical protein